MVSFIIGVVLQAQCSFKGIPLNGRVQFVDRFPDIKVQVVKEWANLHVQKVSNFPRQCGQWQIVNSFPDIRVQIVDRFPDLKIKYVESWPGIR